MSESETETFTDNGQLPRALWPADAAEGWAVLGERVWRAEWAPLREKKFCAHLAERIGAALAGAAGADADALRVEVVLNDDDRRLLIRVRFGLAAGKRAANADALAAALDDGEARSYWIWSAIDATAYKGLAD